MLHSLGHNQESYLGFPQVVKTVPLLTIPVRLSFVRELSDLLNYLILLLGIKYSQRKYLRVIVYMC